MTDNLLPTATAEENADAVIATCRYEADVNLDHSDVHTEADIAADIVRALCQTYGVTP
jgi:hypothetical protein